MMRRLGFRLAGLLVAVAALADTAHATPQFPDRISIGGRIHRLHSTPLESLLTDELRERLDLRYVSSALDRRYIAWWRICGGRLWLDALRSIELESGPLAVFSEREIPMHALGGSPSRAIPATWFTGTLRIPLGNPIRRFHSGWGGVHARMRLIEVRQGRVLRMYTIDPGASIDTRSTHDLRWVARGGPDVVDTDRDWTDARALAPGAQGPIRTRGIFMEAEDGEPAMLWVPETPVSEEFFLPLEGEAVHAFESKTIWPHVDITFRAIPVEAEGPWIVDSIRKLALGQTIHHPTFAPADLAERRARGETPSTRRRLSLYLQDPRQRYSYLDQFVEFWCRPQRRDGRTTFLGLEFAYDGPLGDVKLHVAGELQQWVVTETMLRCQPQRFAAFRQLGPGTYWRIVDPKTGRLAQARVVPPVRRPRAGP